MNEKVPLSAILAAYPVREPSIRFIRHNENMTYRVTDGTTGQSYLLRIHKPVTDKLHGLQHSREGLHAEMQWLADLGAAAGVRVQKPVASHEGEWVTSVNLDAESGTQSGVRSGIFCTLLEWIEGRDVGQGESFSRETVTGLGRQLGAMHRFSQTYPGAAIMKRPRYAGAEQNEEMLTRIRSGLSMDLFREEDLEIVGQTFTRIADKLERHSRSGSSWGLIHADINKGNLIVTDQGLSLIDFCLFGHGYYGYDLAGCALTMKTELRDSVLEGYSLVRPGAVTERLDLLEGFMLLSIFGFYSFHLHNPDKHPWMKERMPAFCKNYCVPFLEDRSLFYTM
ncbi:phosphotransferase [Paenibacillus chitinolyticus]|uniref:Phosphotransferase n=1 Tax=Paenibacillus chitinolyticus TaxID=79263 RepID=A0A410X1N4_9BACL|nr:phosphotransferase [Paenibacillus chitinolyticus]MCY9592608.1 phosphotransferase [Paenibacillus chitinolyticus]MCY9594789.1 phosphotransferase [Paenibacillus chitinolyticus]QAV20523.1 phosphotransferase [Paenibacillus chitinolyticus]